MATLGCLLEGLYVRRWPGIHFTTQTHGCESECLDGRVPVCWSTTEQAYDRLSVYALVSAPARDGGVAVSCKRESCLKGTWLNEKRRESRGVNRLGSSYGTKEEGKTKGERRDPSTV